MPPPGHPAHPASYETYMQATSQWSSAPQAASGQPNLGGISRVEPDPTRCPCGPQSTGSCDACGFGYCDRHGDGGVCISCADAPACKCGRIGAFPCEQCGGPYCRAHGSTGVTKTWDRDIARFAYTGGKCTDCAEGDEAARLEESKRQSAAAAQQSARRSQRENEVVTNGDALVQRYLGRPRSQPSELLIGVFEPPNFKNMRKRASFRDRAEARRRLPVGEHLGTAISVLNPGPYENRFYYPINRVTGWDTGARSTWVEHYAASTGRDETPARDVASTGELWLTIDGHLIVVLQRRDGVELDGKQVYMRIFLGKPAGLRSALTGNPEERWSAFQPIDLANFLLGPE